MNGGATGSATGRFYVQRGIGAGTQDDQSPVLVVVRSFTAGVSVCVTVRVRPVYRVLVYCFGLSV